MIQIAYPATDCISIPGRKWALVKPLWLLTSYLTALNHWLYVIQHSVSYVYPLLQRFWKDFISVGLQFSAIESIHPHWSSTHRLKWDLYTRWTGWAKLEQMELSSMFVFLFHHSVFVVNMYNKYQVNCKNAWCLNLYHPEMSSLNLNTKLIAQMFSGACLLSHREMPTTLKRNLI